VSWRRLFSRDSDEIEEEIRAHLRMAIEERVARGEPLAAAEQAARLEFGNATHVAEVTREQGGRMWLETGAQDLRFALRLMRRNPAFSAAAVATIAIGIGATTAVFSLIDTVLLRSLPVARANELVVLDAVTRRGERQNLPYWFFEQLRDGEQVFAAVFAAQDGVLREEVAPPGGSDVKEARIQLVSGEYFQALGIRPYVGRLLEPADNRFAGGHPAAVVSHAYWSIRLGSDPSVLGRQLRIRDQPYTILGVAPRGFFGHEVGRAPDIWLPLMMQPTLDGGTSYLSDPRVGWLRVMARLGASARTPREAEVALAVVQARANPGVPAERRTRIAVTDARRGLPELREGLAMPLHVLQVIAIIVLVIACANVANLMMARSFARQREVTIRLSIGAGRRRLLRQFLTEGVVLGAIGGALGVLLAWWGGRGLLVLLSSDGVPLPIDVAPNTRLIAFALALTVTTVVGFSLLPAFSATRGEARESLRPDGFRVGARPLSPALVVSEIALALVVVTGAGLFLQTLRNLRGHDLGYSSEGLVQFEVRLDDRPATRPVSGLILARLGSLPGLHGATLATTGFGTGVSRTCCVAVEGHEHIPGEDREVQTVGVVPGYFETMRLPLRGRDFEAHEVTADPRHLPPVAIVNEEFIRRFLDGRDPLGQRFGWGTPPDVTFGIEIVGISKDASYDNPRAEPRPLMYYPSSAGDVFTIRSPASPDKFAAVLQGELRAIDRSAGVVGLASVEALVERTLGRERMMATLSSGFALIAVTLAVIGLHGLMSYVVIARTRDIGVRMALGASRVTVLFSELRRAVTLAVIGVGLGIPVALAAGRLVRSQVFDVAVDDPVTLGVTSILIIVVATGAALIPARRASCVDPVVALRSD
jgi:predicted permease